MSDGSSSCRLHRRGDGRPVGDDGWLDAEHEWVVEGPADMLDAVAAAVGKRGERLAPRVLVLTFGNHVGVVEAGPLGRLRVRSGKWTDAHFDAMLEDITSRAAALPFHAGAASALPYARTEIDAPDVLYHAFLWLRHVLVDRADAPLVGALRAILADPHRRMTREERLAPAERVVHLSPRALDAVAAGAYPLRRVPRGRGLGGGDLFPVEVAETVARPTADTAENRFVKAFLDSCGFLVEAMRPHRPTDCRAIDAALAPVVRHPLWAEVGRLHVFPSSSQVLLRRPAYREVLHHHVLLRLASRALPLSTTEAAHLLEIRDIARLYELWTAFAVIGAVSARKGTAAEARTYTTVFGAKVRAGLLARWADGTEVAYNPSYTATTGFHGRSWSVPLRPDVALYTGGALHLFDAKFKRAGDDAQVDDVHKMHTYRDAIRGARSAWVMYPGERTWWHGEREVGVIAVRPGEPPSALHALVAQLVG